MRAAPTACRRTVSGSLSLLCSRCFSPFPHGTCALSVSYSIFSLTGWARLIHARFLVSRATQDTARLPTPSATGLSPSTAVRSGTFPSESSCHDAVLLPRCCLDSAGLGSSPFARHYWGNHCLFSLPAGTKMFQFPAYAHRTGRCARPSVWRVVPFGNPRIKGHLHLPAAYRSLSRPSSLVRAKASSVRPFLLSFSVLSRTVTFFSLYFVCLACCLLIACFRSCLLVSKCQRSLCQPIWVALWRITDSNR